jgi:hypothetical protein
MDLRIFFQVFLSGIKKTKIIERVDQKYINLIRSIFGQMNPLAILRIESTNTNQPRFLKFKLNTICVAIRDKHKTPAYRANILFN